MLTCFLASTLVNERGSHIGVAINAALQVLYIWSDFFNAIWSLNSSGLKPVMFHCRVHPRSKWAAQLPLKQQVKRLGMRQDRKGLFSWFKYSSESSNVNYYGKKMNKAPIVLLIWTIGLLGRGIFLCHWFKRKEKNNFVVLTMEPDCNITWVWYSILNLICI